MFARELDGGRKAFAELVGSKKIQTRVVGRVLAAFRMDVNSMESAGKDMMDQDGGRQCLCRQDGRRIHGGSGRR